MGWQVLAPNGVGGRVRKEGERTVGAGSPRPCACQGGETPPLPSQRQVYTIRLSDRWVLAIRTQDVTDSSPESEQPIQWFTSFTVRTPAVQQDHFLSRRSDACAC